jgi:hypothetical protein
MKLYFWNHPINKIAHDFDLKSGVIQEQTLTFILTRGDRQGFFQLRCRSIESQNFCSFSGNGASPEPGGYHSCVQLGGRVTVGFLLALRLFKSFPLWEGGIKLFLTSTVRGKPYFSGNLQPRGQAA